MDYAIQTPAQLSAHLRSLREARGMSQAELGRMLGVNQPRIESDPGAISVDQFMRLLSVLGVQLVLSPLHQRELKAAEPPPSYGQTPGEGDW
jgi:HTH-type transcriptional regulator / antitoxin HipB